MNHVFPSQFIYWQSLENHRKIKRNILTDILDDYADNGETYREKMGGVWYCDVTTSFFRTQPLEFLDEDFYRQVVWEPIKKMYEEVYPKTSLSPFSKLGLDEVWYNHYKPGHYQEAHNHYNPRNRSLFSGIYLLNVHEEDHNTVFFHDSDIAAYNGGGTIQFRTTSIGEGSVIIFPSELNHSVAPAKHERITISFNITPIYDD